MMRNRSTVIGLGWLAGLLVRGVVFAQTAAPGFLGGTYRADQKFPEFTLLWREGWKLYDEQGNRLKYARPDMPLGGYLHAFVRNTGPAEVEIDDVSLNGVSLKQGVAPQMQTRGIDAKYASSLQFSKLPADQIRILTELGEPVWWKADPFVLPPGAMAEIIVRLRRPCPLDEIDVKVSGRGFEIAGRVPADRAQPRIVGIGFSPEMDAATLYVRHPAKGMAPDQVLIDGRPVMDGAMVASDPALDLAVAAVRTGKPLREGDFHLFEVRFPDGSAARSGLRVHGSDFVYGMWGGPAKKGGTDGSVARYVERLREHNVNTIMFHYGGEVRNYVRSDEGQAACSRLGLAIMDKAPGGYKNQRYVFLRDEPDAGDVRSDGIAAIDRRVGSLAQWLVHVTQVHRRQDPRMLHVLNIDNTFKPEQWYTYAQLADVPCADPYFQEQLRSVTYKDPGSLPAYAKPTYVYAVGSIYQSACAPRPMHLILHTCRFDMPDEPFRAPTPPEKRVELYYALAAGARGISFWWYTPCARYNGLGSSLPEMRRLYAEIGLVGAEIGTAAPVLARACPAALPIDGPPDVWARSLLAGHDTMVLLVVNDTITCDRDGTSLRPIDGAHLVVRPPAWLQPRDVFEVSAEGIRDLPHRPADASVSIDLGRVEVTRLVIVTADGGLRKRLADRYESLFARNARRLIEEKEQVSKEAGK